MITIPSHGILVVDESNAARGLRWAFVDLQNTKVNPQAYRQLPCTTLGLGKYVSRQDGFVSVNN
jgi:fructose-bisphosphate aldolase class I